MIFYALFSAILSRIPIFKGEADTGLSASGKIIAIALSGLSIMSFFVKYRTADAMAGAISGWFGAVGSLGKIVFAILVFLIIKYGVKDQNIMGLDSNKIALIGTIFVVFFLGSLGEGLGMLMFFAAIGLIIYVAILIFRNIRHRTPGPRQAKDVAKKERRAAEAEETEEKVEAHEEEEVRGLEAEEKHVYEEESAELRKARKLAEKTEEVLDA